MFLNLSSDIITCIIRFLDNRTNCRIISTCKELNIYGKKYGYLTSILLDYKEQYFSFIHKYHNHSNTINKIEIKETLNPHLLIPEYTEILIFSHCSIDKYINPDNIVKTRVLKITDYHRSTNKNVLRINWDKFIHLEYLELYIYNIELKGVEKLEKLLYKKIDIQKLNIYKKRCCISRNS
jgi:hypothetical protein